MVHILTQTGHMDRMAAFVVETASVQDILRFQVQTFLSYTPHTLLCILSQQHMHTLTLTSCSPSSCRSTHCLPWHCTIVVRGNGGERAVPRGRSLTMLILSHKESFRMECEWAQMQVSEEYEFALPLPSLSFPPSLSLPKFNG